ncbi:hypothetical protein MIMGU_mgv11b014706mg [Erythranthe guttata]|uniref:Uncharacterized protein n=1 Tax=Erythranthe guttata TaxID=4155 RepID=A0A022R258_ERYGU|nr:hypothetical protein MIMGU_mgv11b014706mg [Erythranthe guttata]
MLKNIIMQLMFISMLLVNILLLDLLVLACDEISGCKPRNQIVQNLPCKLDDATIFQAHFCGQYILKQ